MRLLAALLTLGLCAAFVLLNCPAPSTTSGGLFYVASLLATLGIVCLVWEVVERRPR